MPEFWLLDAHPTSERRERRKPKERRRGNTERKESFAVRSLRFHCPHARLRSTGVGLRTNGGRRGCCFLSRERTQIRTCNSLSGMTSGSAPDARTTAGAPRIGGYRFRRAPSADISRTHKGAPGHQPPLPSKVVRG